MSLLPDFLHIYAKNEYVGIIEQSICTIKGRARATCHSVPFNIYTSIIPREQIEVVVDLLNRFPSKKGLSYTLSPSTIVGIRQKKIYFGSYFMVQIDTTNTMKIRYVLEIELKAANNYDEYCFINMFTVK